MQPSPASALGCTAMGNTQKVILLPWRMCLLQARLCGSKAPKTALGTAKAAAEMPALGMRPESRSPFGRAVGKETALRVGCARSFSAGISQQLTAGRRSSPRVLCVSKGPTSTWRKNRDRKCPCHLPCSSWRGSAIRSGWNGAGPSAASLIARPPARVTPPVVKCPCSVPFQCIFVTCLCIA